MSAVCIYDRIHSWLVGHAIIPLMCACVCLCGISEFSTSHTHMCDVWMERESAVFSC